VTFAERPCRSDTSRRRILFESWRPTRTRSASSHHLRGTHAHYWASGLYSNGHNPAPSAALIRIRQSGRIAVLRQRAYIERGRWKPGSERQTRPHLLELDMPWQQRRLPGEVRGRRRPWEALKRATSDGLLVAQLVTDPVDRILDLALT